MDSANLRNMRSICGGDPEGKISRLLDWAGLNRDVADPWYTGRFDVTCNDILLGCRALLSAIIEGRI